MISENEKNIDSGKQMKGLAAKIKRQVGIIIQEGEPRGKTGETRTYVCMYVICMGMYLTGGQPGKISNNIQYQTRCM